MATPTPRTELTYQRSSALRTLHTQIVSVTPFLDLEESDRSLYKNGTEADCAIATAATIFHPQGGGQPSDEGIIKHSATNTTFNVFSARMSTTSDGLVLHFGTFPPHSPPFEPGTEVSQHIDEQKRLLYSRLHTAGHVLGAAVRHLLEKQIDGFDELKANHFPDAAACEFAGLIQGSYKDAIQAKVDEYVKAAMPVEIDWWDESDFRREGLERLIPERMPGMGEGEKWRVVKIVGAEVYPCGGTHVGTSEECGATKVKKISRSKGTSRVGYTLVDM